MNTRRNFSNDELDLMLPFQQNGKFRSIEHVTKSNVHDLSILVDSHVYQLNEKMESYEITEMDCDYLISAASKNIEIIGEYIEKLSVLNNSDNKILMNYKFLKARYIDILEILRNYSNTIEDYLNEAEIINSIKEFEDMEGVEDSPLSDGEQVDLDEQLFISTDINKRTRDDIEAECEEKKNDFLKAIKTSSTETIKRFISDVKIMYDGIDRSINDNRNALYKLSEILDYYEFIINNCDGCVNKNTNEPEDHPVISHIKNDTAVRSVDNLIDSYANLLKSVYSNQTKF